MKNPDIRKTAEQALGALGSVAAETEVFPSEYLADLATPAREAKVIQSGGSRIQTGTRLVSALRKLKLWLIACGICALWRGVG